MVENRRRPWTLFLGGYGFLGALGFGSAGVYAIGIFIYRACSIFFETSDSLPSSLQAAAFKSVKRRVCLMMFYDGTGSSDFTFAMTGSSASSPASPSEGRS